MLEKILTRSPVEGLYQKYLLQAERDRQAKIFKDLGFEIQKWQYSKWGITYYGFSYNKMRKLSRKQLKEFTDLEMHPWDSYHSGPKAVSNE